MSDSTSAPSRGPSRSAKLVAACRMLAAELPEHERLIDDPFARLVVDERAVAAARADEHLQNTLRLRTRYIDDAVIAFATRHAAHAPQVLLLGAGFDARAYRIDVPATYYEVDFPATLDDKAELLVDHAPVRPRVVVPVDLAARRFVEPLVEAGFRTDHPTIVVWEGVSMYLDADTAEGVIAQIGAATTAGGTLVADYAEMSWFKGTDLERNTAALAENLDRGGERLKAGVRDMRAALDANGFDVVDDVPAEELRPRYGLEPRPRFYPARMITAVKR
jgi:methyltransferase (TIGR00027 family)